jgi:hypothetical protein
MLLLVLLQFSFISLQAQFSERNTNCANPVVSADMFAANNINTICAGGRTSLRVNITGGQAPYRVVINTGTSDSVITNYTLGRNIIVQPVVTTVYTLKSVTDQTGCALIGLSDTTNIFVNAKPSTAIIYTRTSPASICSGSSTILQVRVFGGVSPFNIVYSDGVNNFSINNITSKSTWDPLPSGDGQKLSLRAQSNGRAYRSYNFSFTEPWLGGKKRNSFSINYFNTKFSNSFSPFGGFCRSCGDTSYLKTVGFGISLGKQLKWPDDYFTAYYDLSYQYYDVVNYSFFPLFPQGYANDIALKYVLQRIVPS